MSNIDSLLEKLGPNKRKPSRAELSEFITGSLKQIYKINESYKRLFEPEGDKNSLVLEIEDHIKELKEGYVDLFESDESGNSKVKKFNQKIEEIEQYHKSLLDGDNSIYSDIKESQSRITDFYVELFGNENTEGQEKKVKSAIQEILEFHIGLTGDEGYIKQIEDAHSKILELYNSFYAESEGLPSKMSEIKNDVEEIESFKKKIIDEIDPFLQNKQEAIVSIENDIKTQKLEVGALLSDATAKTLAQGYLESMGMYGIIKGARTKEWIKNFSTNLFNYFLFIAPLFFIAIIFLQPELIRDMLRLDDFRDVKFTGTEFILYKTAISIPLLWISWYGQKNISYRRRLFEEYNHKLRVVQMYLMFITNNTYKLKPESMSALQAILLEVINRNTSEVYGKDETMLDKIADVFRARKGDIENTLNPALNAIQEVARAK